MRITKKNLDYILCAATLPYCGGGILQYQASASKTIYKLGYVFDYSIVYIQGLGNGQAKALWSIYNHWLNGPGQVYFVIQTSGTPRHFTEITIGAAFDITKIDGNFSIAVNERKIIMSISLATSTSLFVDEHRAAIRDVSVKNIFGFFIYTPQPIRGTAYFLEKLMFTPKPGLFSDTPPS
jgi:hypothetical protein